MRKIDRILISATDRERLDRLVRDRNTPQKAGSNPGMPINDDRFGSMLSKKGFAGSLRAILIQDQARMRNHDSSDRLFRFESFKIQFYSSVADTFSTASVNHVVSQM